MPGPRGGVRPSTARRRQGSAGSATRYALVVLQGGPRPSDRLRAWGGGPSAGTETPSATPGSAAALPAGNASRANACWGRGEAHAILRPWRTVTTAKSGTCGNTCRWLQSSRLSVRPCTGNHTPVRRITCWSLRPTVPMASGTSIGMPLRSPRWPRPLTMSCCADRLRRAALSAAPGSPWLALEVLRPKAADEFPRLLFCDLDGESLATIAGAASDLGWADGAVEIGQGDGVSKLAADVEALNGRQRAALLAFIDPYRPLAPVACGLTSLRAVCQAGRVGRAHRALVWL